MIKYETIPFLNGKLTLFKQEDTIVCLSLAVNGIAEFEEDFPGYMLQQENLPEIALFKQYATGVKIDFTVLKIGYLKSTPFQEAVWQALNCCRGLLTYEQLAQKINRPTAIRAVATAVGKNPIPIINACHHIVPKSGGVGKFRYGTALKQQLLTLENLI
ncbi:hypothetical protein GCM10025879_17130 [Leuconostoc litchii]|uniref:Methylated-DNA--[protein]-cysteine S-methyltransferase n=1 Tax=Leuconostoc litchii TaxID=1981069 RepID=A0A6P2CQR1_9LACO|nr:methylated-DNA--[protein]-cysteine S-methyltransferase [Leuconostoc litchii]TYC46609.1 methylated-DNA--[protein]-cysteine S-methyltransferase [Leuconostoc litchii]GMA70467.1 hypothetical protein GCM10025879_17130 [Leuconostoc litchii]